MNTNSKPSRAPKILLTGAGGAAAISVMKALKDEPYELFAVDMDFAAAGLYLVDSAHRGLVPRGDDPHFVSAVLELCRQWDIDILIPTVDTELLPVAAAREAFEDASVMVMSSREHALAAILDKWNLVLNCAGSLPVPNTVLGCDITEMAGEFKGPVIIKPRRGSGSDGVAKFSSIKNIPVPQRTKEWIVQEYLPGEEYSVDVLATPDGRVVAAVPRERMKVDSGIAVASRTVIDEELEEFATLAAAVTGVRFTANVQFKRRADGTPVLLEINPRFPGTMPLTVQAGVNMPKWCVEMCLGAEPPVGMMPFEEIGVVRYWQEEFIPASQLSAGVRAPEQKPSPRPVTMDLAPLTDR